MPSESFHVDRCRLQRLPIANALDAIRFAGLRPRDRGARFRNAASFSKAFREQYGYSAREAVQQASAGTGAGRGKHEVQGLFAPLMH
jgi:hypothetical protein